ncbi:MAG: hypothetical protein ACLUFH_02080 [Monoglobales bacterium]
MIIIRKILKYIEEEDAKGLFRFCLIILPFIVGLIWTLCVSVNYITQHKEAIIVLGIAACIIVPPMLGKNANKAAIMLPTAPSTAVNNIAYFDEILLTYLYQLFKSYAGKFHVMAPVREEDVKAHIPTGKLSNTNIPVYRYMALSDGEPIPPQDFQNLLNRFLQKDLASKALDLGTSIVEFNGQLYPKVYIYECNQMGGTWYLELLICDNIDVAKRIDSKRNALERNALPVQRHFKDCDF